MSETSQPSFPQPLDGWVVPHLVKMTETVSQLAALGQATNDRLDILGREADNTDQIRLDIIKLFERVSNVERDLQARQKAEEAQAAQRKRAVELREEDSRNYRIEAWKAAAAAIFGALISQAHSIYNWLATLHH